MWWGRNTQFGPKTCRFFWEPRPFVAVVVVVAAAVTMLLFDPPQTDENSVRSQPFFETEIL